MCGRYATTVPAPELARIFDAVDETDGGSIADFNVAPTDPMPIVRVARRGLRVVSVARWGFVPSWAADRRGAARMINARAETVATSRVYGRAFARQRCLVPADGWYEWIRRPGRRPQPYFMTTPGRPLVFGGLWSAWGDGDDLVFTVSVVTRPAAARLAQVHDRMPLVLSPELWEPWLVDPDPAALLGPPAEDLVEGIEVRPVSTLVGDVRQDGPKLIERLDDATTALF